MTAAFLHTNALAAAAAVSASTAEASAPASNLLDPQPRLRMRCIGGAAILVDLGSSRAIDCVALISTNATATALARVRLSTTDITGVTGDAWDTGTISAATDVGANGNFIAVRTAGTATGRYALVELLDAARTYIDVGILALGALWRLTRAQSYGFREGRLMLDQRDRNPLTGAEFPSPALLNPRFTAFRVENMSNAETTTQHREMLRRLGAVGDALWIPDIDIAQSEINRRAVWGAAAQPGEDAGAERATFVGWTRTWRLIERG